MKFSEKQLSDYITDILLEGNVLKKDEKLPEILPDTDLQSIGMNSILFIQFIVFLENTYSIEINDDDLLMERFSSINQIMITMEKYEEGANSNEI
jgi:acyl carrier protein